MNSVMMRTMAIIVFVAATTTGACSSSHDSPPQQSASQNLPDDPDALAAPESGKGFQIKTDDIAVPAGVEEQDCYFFRVSDLAASGGLPPDQPVNVHDIQIVQREGSHHMNIFRVRTIVGLDPANGAVQRSTNGTGPCFVSANWADWPLVVNTQVPGAVDWKYPDGVAIELEPDETIMLQSHYVNATTQQTPLGAGKVAVNFVMIPKEQVTAQLGTLFSTNQSIRVCSKNPTPTFQHGCQIPGSGVRIIGANGHFHSRGVDFDMYTWDGTSTTTPDSSALFYHDTQWAEPPMAHFPDLDVPISTGGGVWYTCSYQWQPPPAGCDALNASDAKKNGTQPDQLDCCYTFGPQVDTNEHCNAFVYYYPKADNVTCF